MELDTGLDPLVDELPASDVQPTLQPAVEPSLAPFYDPIDDDRNEEWALKQRQGRKSDAVLTCPACLTTLCIDCQRHELYVNQYRAMFVRKCTIVETERLRYSDNKKRKRNARRKSRVQEDDIPVGGPGMTRINPKDVRVGEEVYKPVRCAECGAEVAVIDSDEVLIIIPLLKGAEVTMDLIVGCIPQILNPDPTAMSKIVSENASEEFLYSLSNYCGLQVCV